jgi:hypothetical protein
MINPNTMVPEFRPVPLKKPPTPKLQNPHLNDKIVELRDYVIKKERQEIWQKEQLRLRILK